jgi:hypothetical protein
MFLQTSNESNTEYWHATPILTSHDVDDPTAFDPYQVLPFGFDQQQPEQQAQSPHSASSSSNSCASSPFSLTSAGFSSPNTDYLLSSSPFDPTNDHVVATSASPLSPASSSAMFNTSLASYLPTTANSNLFAPAIAPAPPATHPLSNSIIEQLVGNISNEAPPRGASMEHVSLADLLCNPLLQELLSTDSSSTIHSNTYAISATQCNATTLSLSSSLAPIAYHTAPSTLFASSTTQYQPHQPCTASAATSASSMAIQDSASSAFVTQHVSSEEGCGERSRKRKRVTAPEDSRVSATMPTLTKEQLNRMTIQEFTAYQTNVEATYSLTSEQRKTLSAQRRQVRNREYAQQSRQKRKIEQNGLQEQLSTLQTENTRLKTENAQLKSTLVQVVNGLERVRLNSRSNNNTTISIDATSNSSSSSSNNNHHHHHHHSSPPTVPNCTIRPNSSSNLWSGVLGSLGNLTTIKNPMSSPQIVAASGTCLFALLLSIGILFNLSGPLNNNRSVPPNAIQYSTGRVVLEANNERDNIWIALARYLPARFAYYFEDAQSDPSLPTNAAAPPLLQPPAVALAVSPCDDDHDQQQDDLQAPPSIEAAHGDVDMDPQVEHEQALQREHEQELQELSNQDKELVREHEAAKHDEQVAKKHRHAAPCGIYYNHMSPFQRNTRAPDL